MMSKASPPWVTAMKVAIRQLISSGSSDVPTAEPTSSTTYHTKPTQSTKGDMEGSKGGTEGLRTTRKIKTEKRYQDETMSGKY